MSQNHVKIKLCGMMCVEDIYAANELLPDYVGFVFAPSKRIVSDERALGMKHVLNPKIKAVGVFVNDRIEHIAYLVNHGIIDLVQLHGDENEFYIHQLQMQCDAPITKAIRVQSSKQVLEAAKLPVDYLLLDAYVEGTAGGSGTGFDVSLIPKIEIPYFLAGGLMPENVTDRLDEIKKAVQEEKYFPFAVDASSSLETNGKKDAKKMQAFVDAVRSW